MTFDEAFERLIGHEGGYANHPSDPGGETNFGISKRSYPNENIKSMTLKRAKAIYLKDFWSPSGAEMVPEAIKFDLFDTAVNSGVQRAVLLLQEAVGAVEDGQLGPKTLAAVRNTDPERVSKRFNGSRLIFMTNLSTWPQFGKGWARRIASNLLA